MWAQKRDALTCVPQQAPGRASKEDALDAPQLGAQVERASLVLENFQVSLGTADEATRKGCVGRRCSRVFGEGWLGYAESRRTNSISSASSAARRNVDSRSRAVHLLPRLNHEGVSVRLRARPASACRRRGFCRTPSCRPRAGRRCCLSPGPSGSGPSWSCRRPGRFR